MKPICKQSVLLIILLLISGPVLGQYFLPEGTELNKPKINPYEVGSAVSYLEPQRSWQDTAKSTMSKLDKFTKSMEWYMIYFPMPFASYSDETDLLFGISKYNAFTLRRGDKSDTITQNSSITFFGYFTFNKQYKSVLESNLMLNKNRALWRTLFVYSDYPLEYFGIGNETNLDNQQTLITSDWQVSVHYLFKTYKKWYVGPIFDFYNFYRVEFDDGTTPGGDEHNLGRQSALGLKVQMEGRDNRLNARNGFYVDASYQLFREALGGQFNYNAFLVDLRYYYSFRPKLTIASQIRTEARSGDVPVQSLSQLGGDYAMRGTYRGRYRDLVLVDTQLELRFPIFWIFSGTVFNSLGQVAPAYSEVKFNRFHYNYGLGLRVLVDSAHDVNLRFDFGISSDQTYFIVNFAEAF